MEQIFEYEIWRVEFETEIVRIGISTLLYPFKYIIHSIARIEGCPCPIARCVVLPFRFLSFASSSLPCPIPLFLLVRSICLPFLLSLPVHCLPAFQYLPSCLSAAASASCLPSPCLLGRPQRCQSKLGPHRLLTFWRRLVAVAAHHPGFDNCASSQFHGPHQSRLTDGSTGQHGLRCSWEFLPDSDRF